MWTRFMDMSSGGSSKEDFKKLLIEAPEAEARVIFYNLFGHNPDRVTCTCCGPDYSIDQNESLAQITAYDRHCTYSSDRKCWVEEVDRSIEKYGGKYELITLEDYIKQKDVRVIYASEIKQEHRNGDVPVQGYVYI